MKRVFCCVGVLLCFVLLQSAIAQTYRIYIDPGHYKGNGASHMHEKTGELIREEDINLAVALKLRNLLESSTLSPPHFVTWDVRMSRDTGVSRTDEVTEKEGLNLNNLRDRAIDANHFGKDHADRILFLSIHSNKDGGKGDGTETFWNAHATEGEESERFAILVQNHMVDRGWTKEQDRRVGEDVRLLGHHLAVLENLTIPGCLNEIGFLDNQKNLEKLVSPYWQHRFAEAYRDAIFEYVGLEMPEYLTVYLEPGQNMISWPGIPIGTGSRGVLINSEQFPATRILRRWNPEKKEHERVSQVVFGEGYLLYVPARRAEGELLDISFFPQTSYTLQLKSGFNMIGSVSGHTLFSTIVDRVNRGGVQCLDSTFLILRNGRLTVDSDGVMRPGVGYLVRACKDVEITVSASLAAPSVVSLPAETQLFANFPNPFNPETWIPFHLQNAGEVTLSIYGVSGHLVRTMPLGHLSSGFYDTKDTAAYWDGRNEHGTQVASGIYFYTLETQGVSFTRKMVVLK